MTYKLLWRELKLICLANDESGNVWFKDTLQTSSLTNISSLSEIMEGLGARYTITGSEEEFVCKATGEDNTIFTIKWYLGEEKQFL